MKTQFSRALATLLIGLFSLSPVWATCGGGGGGGTGGVGGGGRSEGPAPVVYKVPWNMYEPRTAPHKGLVLYWFPASDNELSKSSLRWSRILTLYSAQCVTMTVADAKQPELQPIIGDSAVPVAVLANSDGSSIKKIENTAGKLKVEQVEKLVEAEMKQRETALDTSMKDAKEKAKAGDKDGAIALLKPVADEKCLFPKKAKDAAKELKKLGVEEIGSIPDSPSPIFDRVQSAKIEAVMRQGLRAEIAERYVTAERLYQRAHQMDPADPTPLRYLGEVYRHHTGQWDKARATFNTILNMPADPVARAVALHGLGKMTIHDGEFKKGLSLMEQSVAEFPLALAYRNLAVYWNSEGDLVQANAYTQKALKLDPKDPYNLVFAAVFMAASGNGDEALKIAQANRNLLPASYNLAAIYAQTGHRREALALLQRHFFQYERYQAVRAKEMMEARVDAVFDSLRQDSQFLALTSGADGKLQMPMRNMTGSSNRD
jgi:tetratricopeptide (TPR) repeat protein